MSVSLNNEKLIQILRILLKKDFVSLDEFSEQLDVGKRSVGYYIQQINQELEHVAAIKNKRGRGYYLIVHDKKVLEQIVEEASGPDLSQDSLQTRLAFIIDKLMKEAKTTLDDLAEEMNISRSTLVNDLKKIEVVLDPYGIEIKGKPNSGISLVGDELHLRLFIIENIYSYLYKESPVDKDVEDEILSIARKYDFDEVTTNRLISTVAVILERFLTSHPIESLDEKYHRLIGTAEFGIALEMKDMLVQKLSVSLPLPEVLFLTIPIAGRRTPTRISSVSDIPISQDVTTLLKSIRKRIEFELSIYFDEKEFSKDIEYHISFLLNRLIFGIQNPNPLIHEVKGKYPLAFKMAGIAGDIIEETIGIRPSEDELGYLAFYFEIYLSQHGVRAKSLQQVAIVCGTGRGTAKLISIQLRKIIGYQTRIDLFSEKDTTAEELSNYDVVLATVPINCPVDAPVIRTSEIFDEKNLAQQINKAVYLYKYAQIGTNFSASIIANLLTPTRFFVFDRNISYEEGIRQMAEALADREFVDKAFPLRLAEREKQSTMVYDRYIALPHTVQYASDKIILAAGVLQGEEAVSGNVRLIFMLALPENTNQDEGLLVKIYNEIIEISRNEKLVLELAAVSDVEQFLARLFEYEKEAKR